MKNQARSENHHRRHPHGCTLVKVRFRGESYCFTYFTNGELKEYEFDGDELEALGAKEDKES